MEDLKKLLKQVGRQFELLNKDGTYQGCFYPFQVIYPDIPKYRYKKDLKKSYLWGIKELKKYAVEVPKEEIKQGDVIATMFRGVLHIAIYYEYGKIIHVFSGHTLQISHLKIFKDYKVFRIIYEKPKTDDNEETTTEIITAE